MKNFSKLFLVVMLVLAFSVVSFAAEMDRSETLVFSGGMWGPPSSWNPLHPNPAAGTIGLVYEPLFMYSPVTNEYRPYLAEEGEWTSDNVYTLKVREEAKWSDGEDVNAEDVAFTYQLAQDNPLTYSPIWEWMSSVEVVDNYTVKFTFSEPHYAEWDKELYTRAIIPEHIWSNVAAGELMTLANQYGVGSGSYMYESVSQTRMVWVRNDKWWGNDVFGTPKPKYLVNLVNTSNNITLGMLMKGELDQSNNFIPGVAKVKTAFGLNTWYEDEPYMLSWNTANVYMNTNVKPMDDAKFRRALAFAMNKDTIVDKVYGGLVQPANPTGLFGEGWMKYYDQDVVDEYGFSYDPTTAESMLDEAGYVDLDGDGWRDQSNGDPIELEIIVPSGWTDWMESIKIIANNAQAVGVNIQTAFPASSVYDDRRLHNSFELIIANQQTTLSSTPFDYWNAVANSNIKGAQISSGNWGAYDNQELFDKIDQFNMTRDETVKRSLAGEIQTTLLEDMPTIPLWHNGLWAQQTSNHWTNWPSEDNPYGVAVSWGGAYQLGMIDVLINIEPVN